jgi:hypothetical protein
MNKIAVLIAVFLISGSCFLCYSIYRGLVLEIPQLPFEIVPNLPLDYWFAMVLILCSLVLYVISEETFDDFFNLLMCFLVYLLFFGYFPLAEVNLRYFDSWDHTIMTEYIVNNGHTSAEIFYHNWPGFHIWYAMLKEVNGMGLYVLGRFSPVILNLLFFLFLYLILRKVGNTKAALVGTIGFIVADDRFYFTVQPVVLSCVLFASAAYIGFFKHQDWRSALTTTILLCVAVAVHPLNILWSLIPMLVLILMLGLSSRMRDLNKRYSINNLLTQFGIVLVFWVIWNVSAVQNATPTTYSIFHDLLTTLLKSFSGAVSHGAIVQYAPSYWYRGTPLACEYMSMAVIGLVLVTASVGFFSVLPAICFSRYAKSRNKSAIGHSNTNTCRTAYEYWAVAATAILISDVFLGIFPVVTGISLSTSSIMWGWTDRALLFIWVPISMFVCYFFMTTKRRRVKKVFAVLLVLSIFPSFLSNHWLESLPMVHSWETSGIRFFTGHTRVNNPSTIVLTDDYTKRGLWNASMYDLKSEGVEALPGQKISQVWNIFTGEVSPTSIPWTYFFESRIIEIAFPVNYGCTANYKMDQALINSSLVNLIYNSAFVRIYCRNETIRP